MSPISTEGCAIFFSTLPSSGWAAAWPRLGRAFRTAPVSRQTNPNPVWHSPRFHSRPATLLRPPFCPFHRSALFLPAAALVKKETSRKRQKDGMRRRQRAVVERWQGGCPMARNGTLAKSQELQPSFHATTEQITIGIDLGDRFSHCCVLGPDGKILTEGRLRSTPETMARHFQNLPPARIAIEVGTHSRWVSQLLGQWGHE